VASPDTLYLFTADHGHVRGDAAKTIYINEVIPELADCLPVSPTTAHRLGLVDAIGPDDPVGFDRWASQVATEVAAAPPKVPPPIDTRPYRQRELADMWRDIHEDRHGFEAKRRHFLGVAP